MDITKIIHDWARDASVSIYGSGNGTFLGFKIPFVEDLIKILTTILWVIIIGIILLIIILLYKVFKG